MADILVVDDDQSVASAFERFLAFEGHQCRLVSNADDALQSIEERRPDLVMMDIRMPGVDGLQALEQVRARFPGLSVVMMTGYGTSQTSIDAIRAGAFDYLTKPPDLDDLRAIIGKALAASKTANAVAPGAAADGPSVALIGDTPAMREVYKLIGRLATNDVPALIVGELGTGKGLVVSTLHDSGSRRSRPLLVIDCAHPHGSLEEDLFAPGIGTVHLENVESLPLPLQLRLARALSNPGRAPGPPLEARLIASTARDLADAVTSAGFSRELHDILALITIRLPPLRERREDIPLLVRHFVQRFNVELNRTIKGVDEPTLRRLQDHAWPGNVGQLERVLKHGAIVARGEVITSDDVGSLADTRFQRGGDAESALGRAVRSALHDRLVDASSSPSASAFHDIVDLVEMTLVKEALVITNRNQVKAADLIGVNRSTIRKKAPPEDV